MFEIGIPTLNRGDLLNPTLWIYYRDFPDNKIWVLDNGNQNIAKPPNVEVIKQNTNIGVGASWNLLCNKIFDNPKNEYAVILNDDIYLGKSGLDISNIIKSNKNSLIRSTIDWCAFIIPRSIHSQIKFDECFYPAYYEDKSYEYRLKLAGVRMVKTPMLNPYLYQSSKTIEKDISLFESSKKNKELYIKMWGGLPEKEKFLNPYNSIIFKKK